MILNDQTRFDPAALEVLFRQRLLRKPLNELIPSMVRLLDKLTTLDNQEKT
jgi:hypothetical protein